jgi:hypothetical protein
MTISLLNQITISMKNVLNSKTKPTVSKLADILIYSINLCGILFVSASFMLPIEPRTLTNAAVLICVCNATVNGVETYFLKRNYVRSRLVQNVPGMYLFKVAEFLMTAKSFSRVAAPSLSDMREEYFEALSQNRIWKARWVRVRGTYSFFAAIGLDRAFAFVSFFIKAWKSVN